MQDSGLLINVSPSVQLAHHQKSPKRVVKILSKKISRVCKRGQPVPSPLLLPRLPPPLSPPLPSPTHGPPKKQSKAVDETEEEKYMY